MALALLILGAAGLAAYGAWRGRVGAVNLAGVVATGAFSASAWLLYRLKAYRVLGLLGPLMVALLVGVAVAVVFWLRWRRRGRAEERPPPSRLRRALLGALGALEGAGLVLLVVLALALVERRFAERPSEGATDEGSWSVRELFADMTHLLNRGLLSHVPVADRFGQALTDLATILNASPEALARAGETLRIGRLARLPVVQEALADPAVNQAIDDLSEGHLGALYRLQADPHVRALAEDPTFRAAVRRLTLSEMARAVRAEEAPSGPKPPEPESGP